MIYHEEKHPDRTAKLLAALRQLLNGEEYDAIELSVESVLERVLLGRILTDPAFASIRELPDVYLASTDEAIREFLNTAGASDLVGVAQRRQIRTLLLRGEAYGGRSVPVSDSTFSQVARKVLQTGVGELRCASCGYHFRYSDLLGKRRKLAKDLDLVLASSVHPAREVDQIKRPIMTELEVDHVVPRAGWGPSDASNLQFLCRLCNQGKSIYIRALESISILAAGSYGRDNSIERYPNRVIFYSAMQHWNSTCSICSKGPLEAELTVNVEGDWFVPWVSKVVCYECA